MTELFKVLGLYCRIWIVCLCLITLLVALLFSIFLFFNFQSNKGFWRYMESNHMKASMDMQKSTFCAFGRRTLCRPLNSTFPVTPPSFFFFHQGPGMNKLVCAGALSHSSSCFVIIFTCPLWQLVYSCVCNSFLYLDSTSPWESLRRLNPHKMET